MKLKVQGKVHAIGKTQTIGANGFTKRELVLDITDQNAKYPNYALFEFVKDKCNNLDRYTRGDVVEVEFFLDAREWKGKWFGSCRGWEIYPVQGQTAAAQPNEDLAYDAVTEEAQSGEDFPF